MFTVGVAAAHQRFAWTWGVMMAVAVTLAMPWGVAVHIDLRPSRRLPMGGGGAGVGTATGTTGTPAVPDVIPLGAVMDEDEEAEGDREGTVEAAEDHVQEVSLRHRQSAERPRGQEQEEREGRRAQLSLEGVLVSQEGGVYGDSGATGRAVAATGRCRQGPWLRPLVTVGRHVHGRQPLLLLCQLLELVLLLRMATQLDEGTQEVDARYQNDEGHGTEEGAQTGLPRHPAAATHTQCLR